MDFRVFIDNDLEEVSRILKEICESDVEDDAIRYDTESMRMDVIDERTAYPGFRVRFSGYIDKVEIPIQLDLGFSDEVIPPPKIEQFPTILDFPAPVVYVYQPETSLSEKVEAIFYHGEINSRMNDFYDIWSISNEFKVEGNLLVEAMSTTFRNRGTGIEQSLSELFSDTFIDEKNDLWNAFLSRIGEENSVHNDFNIVLSRIEEFVQPVLDVIASKSIFDKTWDPKLGWV
jgi:hypothetical protein